MRLSRRCPASFHRFRLTIVCSLLLLPACSSDQRLLFSEGEEQLRARRYGEAYETFTLYLKLDSLSPGGYYNRALALVGLDRFQEALDDLDRTARLTPDDVEIYLMRYRIRSLVREFIRNDTNVSAELRPVRGGLESAYTVSMKAELDKILQLSRNDVWELNERGRMKHDEGDYDGALADYAAGLMNCDTCTFVLYNKALSLRASWRAQEALEALHELLDIDSQEGDAWLLMGECYFALGKGREACNVFRRAIRLGVAEAEERLETLCR